MIKKIITVCLFAGLVSGCDAEKIKPYGLVLGKEVSQVDLQGFSLVDSDGKKISEPTKLGSRALTYIYFPTSDVDAMESGKSKDGLGDYAMFLTIEGKIAMSSTSSKISEMEKAQKILQEKYGPPLATRAGIRDKTAFESSVGYCRPASPVPSYSREDCPLGYYEIYGNVDEAYVLVKVDIPGSNKPISLGITSITRDAVNYSNSLK